MSVEPRTSEIGISMAECKAGAIVWVRRKNGSWWPGRVMDLTEVSSSSFYKSGLHGKPVQLLGRDNGSVDWYSINSKRIKEFRSCEFVDCIKSVESTRVTPSTKPVKYARRIDAILHALELENKEKSKKRKRKDSKAEINQDDSVCKSKRSRCDYFPIGSRKCLERTSFHAQPSQAFARPCGVGGHSYKSSSSENKYSFRSSETRSLNNHTRSGDKDETNKQLPDCHSGYPSSRNYKKHDEISSFTFEEQTAADVEVSERKMKLKSKYQNKRSRDIPDGQRYITSTKRIHDKKDPSTVYAALEHHTRTRCYRKSSKELKDDAYFPSQSALQDRCLDFPRRQTRSGSSRKILIDAKLIVQANYKGEHVPLVSLVSKLNGEAIIGHPVEVEALKDGSTGILLPMSDDVGDQMFDGICASLLQPVPKTARTPVCYLLTPPPSSQLVPVSARTITVFNPPTPSPFTIPKNVNLVNGRLETRKNSSLSKDKLLKPLKKRVLSNQKVIEPNQRIKPRENLYATESCVPVKLIMSNLLTALGVQPGAAICD